MIPTKISFEKQYSDGSGVEYGVYFDTTSLPEIRLVSSGDQSATIGVEQLDWLRDCLYSISEIQREIESQKPKKPLDK